MNTEDYLNKVRTRIKQLVELYQTKQKEIAIGTNELTEQMICYYMNSKRNVTGRSLIILSLAYGISTDWILGLTEKPYTEESIKNAEEQYKKEFPEIEYNPKIKYNLEARANIITLSRLIYYKKQKNIMTLKLKILENNLKYTLETGIPSYEITKNKRRTTTIEKISEKIKK